MVKHAIKKYMMMAAIVYLVLVLVPSLYLKLTNYPYFFNTLSLVNGWLASQMPVYWADIIKSYGHYLMANLEIATILLILFPGTRLLGAFLGLMTISIPLSAHLVTPLGIVIPIGADGQSDGGLVFALACGVVLACVVLIWSQYSDSIGAYTEPKGARVSDRNINKMSGAQAVAIEDLSTIKDNVPFETEVTIEVFDIFHQILFDRKHRVRDEVTGDHKGVIEQAEKLIGLLPEQRKYFPRKPMIIPKLLRAVNSESSTKKDLVEVISEDPVLAGELLKIANSPFYRVSEEPVESIGRAIVLLGMNGLKALASTLVMQPVVQVEVGNILAGSGYRQ